MRTLDAGSVAIREIAARVLVTITHAEAASAATVVTVAADVNLEGVNASQQSSFVLRV